MHRADAATVSYTEVTVSSRLATMRYHGGTPCRAFKPDAGGAIRMSIRPLAQ